MNKIIAEKTVVETYKFTDPYTSEGFRIKVHRHWHLHGNKTRFEIEASIMSHLGLIKCIELLKEILEEDACSAEKSFPGGYYE